MVFWSKDMRFKRYYFFIALGLILLLAAFQNPPANDFFHRLSLTIAKPLLAVVHAVPQGIQKSRQGLDYFWRSFQDQSRYKSQITEFQSKLAGYEEAMRENERLRKLLGFKKSVPVRSVAANVIGWDSSPWRKTILIDKGSSQGIKKDMSVVLAEGLVGRIMEVTPNSARALLITDPDSHVTSLTGKGRVQGIAEGNGDAALEVTYLDLEGTVEVGEEILTSGVGGLYPKGLSIGKVLSVSRDASGLYLAAKVQPFVDFSKLEEVLCIEFSRSV